MTAGVWPAKYSGACLACEGRIHVDDPVKWADGNVVHADCDVLDHATLRPIPPTCPRCYMVPSVTGLCGCDE